MGTWSTILIIQCFLFNGVCAETRVHIQTWNDLPHSSTLDFDTAGFVENNKGLIVIFSSL